MSSGEQEAKLSVGLILRATSHIKLSVHTFKKKTVWYTYLHSYTYISKKAHKTQYSLSPCLRNVSLDISKGIFCETFAICPAKSIHIVQYILRDNSHDMSQGVLRIFRWKYLLRYVLRNVTTLYEILWEIYILNALYIVKFISFICISLDMFCKTFVGNTICDMSWEMTDYEILWKIFIALYTAKCIILQ